MFHTVLYKQKLEATRTDGRATFTLTQYLASRV